MRDEDPTRWSTADDEVDAILTSAAEVLLGAPGEAYDVLLEAQAALSSERFDTQAQYAGQAYVALAGPTDIRSWSEDEKRFAHEVAAAARSWLGAASRLARQQWAEDRSTETLVSDGAEHDGDLHRGRWLLRPPR